jgi:hypothetical protein
MRMLSPECDDFFIADKVGEFVNNDVDDIRPEALRDKHLMPVTGDDTAENGEIVFDAITLSMIGDIYVEKHYGDTASCYSTG